MTVRMWRHLGEQAATWPGRHWPLGSQWSPEATNFAVHAPHATAVWVCLFPDGPDDPDDPDSPDGSAGSEQRVPLLEHTLGVWHGAVPGVAAGTRYGYRADGPWDPRRGHVFNPAKLLLDPYARAVSGAAVPDPALYAYDVDDPARPSRLDSAPVTPRSVVVADDHFDWGEDRPMRRRWRDTVIYELHVAGMTALHDRVPEHLRGTYAGLATAPVVDYLRDLGVTAVELLPIQQFVPEPAVTRRGLTNYWGYNTIGFFAPHGAYAAAGDRGQQIEEFKHLVKTLHAAGIEVLLDVVYNHTAESDPLGPTLCFRGLDDAGIYTLDGGDQPVGGATDDASDSGEPARYWDVTGCGNTVDVGKPFALRLVLDSLRYWAQEMHVDGFRFDLLSALTRRDRAVDLQCALLTTIAQDPVLERCKLIAEPWDASADGYLVGRCPPPWTEWNDQYRGELRDFWRGTADGVRTFATRVAGSSDLYADDGRSPYASINFVTAHDGFTLRDLVSYAVKHNEANGEDNRDGSDDNRSDNLGVEGETDDPRIVARRRRRATNLLVTLLLSNGVPMITAGDERGRTQRGNNNAYCQDNEISWLDWRPDDAWLDVYEQTRAALRLRAAHPVLRQRHWFEGRPTVTGGNKDLAWLHPDGRELTEADWHDGSLRTLGMYLHGSPLRSPGPRGEQETDVSFLIWFHAGEEPVQVQLPSNDGVGNGEVVLSTDPDLDVGTPVAAADQLRLGGCSVVVLRET